MGTTGVLLAVLVVLVADSLSSVTTCVWATNLQPPAFAAPLDSLVLRPSSRISTIRPPDRGGFRRKSARCAGKAELAMTVKRIPGPLPIGLHERSIVIGEERFTVVEVAKTADLVEDWIAQQMATTDPFGVVLWPAAQVLAGVIVEKRDSIAGKRVLELGAGTGLCSLVAAHIGASTMASDTNEQALDLVDLAAERAGVQVETSIVDITGSEAFPEADVIVAADCMCSPPPPLQRPPASPTALHPRYNAAVARALARRVVAALGRGVSPLVADSVNIAREEFEAELAALGCAYALPLPTLPPKAGDPRPGRAR
jgi:hypothetical protein